MADEAGKFGWVGEAIKSVAGIAVVGLIGLGAAKLGLAPKPDDLTDQENWPLWAALVGLYATYEIARRPAWRTYQHWRVAEARADRLAVLIARLDGDADGSLRETVRESIKREFQDSVELILWPEALRLADGSDADAEATALRTAHAWLRRKRCDILLWGRLKSSEVLSLRLTVAESQNGAPESYKLTEDKLDLPVEFLSNLGAAISARIVANAAPALQMGGQYIVPLMRQAALRLEPFVSRMNPAFDTDTRGVMLYSYGLIRAIIGQQAGTVSDLEEAVVAYRAALQERTREHVPLDWATTQNDLGVALSILGEHESGTARLEEAVVAYREALQERTREQVPLDWATTQNNLGNALQTLGERESGTAGLEKAVTAYRAALEERTRKRVPLEWAMTQNNLANALQILGTRVGDTVRLEEAVAAYRAALQEYTRERGPLDWATTQNNLGVALRVLGERESGTARLEAAVAAHRAALQEQSRERTPLDWAKTQANLALAFLALHARTEDASSLAAALAGVNGALEEFRKAGADFYIQKTDRYRAEILRRMA